MTDDQQHAELERLWAKYGHDRCREALAFYGCRRTNICGLMVGNEGHPNGELAALILKAVASRLRKRKDTP